MRRFLAGLLIVCGLTAWIGSAGAWWQSIQQVAIAAGGNAVTLDQAGTTVGVAANIITYTTLTISGGLTNPGLVCVVTNSSGTSMTSPAAIWDNGGSSQSMTVLINQDGAAGKQVIIFGLRNPVSGSKTLVFSWTGTVSTAGANCLSFSHVNQTNDATAFPNYTGSNTGATPDSITITSGTNNYVVAGYSSLANFSSVSDNQLILDNTGAVWAIAANYKASTGATDTLTGSPGSVTSSVAGGAIAHD